MEGTWVESIATGVRARRSLPVLDRLAGDLLGVDVPGVLNDLGNVRVCGGRATAGDGRARDAGAERDRIPAAVRRAHQRRARRRRVVGVW